MKLNEFLPDLAAQHQGLVKMNTAIQNVYDGGFSSFAKGRMGGGMQTSSPSPLGIEQLYFDWLRTAYAYRRQFIQDLYLLAYDVTEIRTPLLHLRGEIFRKGLDAWIPKFAVKCERCGEEYDEVKKKCARCGNKEMKKPDHKQVEYFDEMRKSANIFGQSFEEVLLVCEDDMNIVDDCFIHLQKQYLLSNENLWSRVLEIRRIHPALMEFDLDKAGLPRNSHWLCPFHRDDVEIAPGPCGECGFERLPVMYIYNHRGKRVYLLEEEIIHMSKFSPSETYGYSPLLTIMQKVLTISGMDRFLYRYFFERKAPTGMILTYTDDPQSLEVERARIEAKMMEDPTYMPWVAVSQKTGRGRCVTGDTYIWTSKGLLTAKELHEGGYTSVETIDGMKPILDKVKYDNKPIIKTVFGQNITVKSTYNHPFFTRNGWVKAEDLTSNDYVLTSFSRNSFAQTVPILPTIPITSNCHQKEFILNETELTEDIAKLIGYYIAEGHISQDGKYINIACKKEEVIKDLKRILSTFGIEGHYYTKECSLRISNELFTTWFKELIGWEFNGSYRKAVPLIIRQSPKKYLLAFLAGYFTDGALLSYKKPGSKSFKPIFEWSSTSEQLLKEIQQLLFNMGIKSRLGVKPYTKHLKHHDGTLNTDNKKWYLYIEGLMANHLATLLNPYIVYYQDKFAKTMAYTRKQEKMGNTAYLEDEKGTWLKVRRQEKCENEDVYDLTVKDTHSYVANGLIVHNTDFVRLFHTLQEMDYMNVRNEIRDRIASMYGVPQVYLNIFEGVGAMSGQSQQLKVFSNIIDADQRRYNEKLFPQLLKAFHITDWSLKLLPPEEKIDSMVLQQAQQRVAIATQMMTLGFQVELKPGTKNIKDLDFIFTGKVENPMQAMMGGAGGMPQLPPGGAGSQGGEGAEGGASSMTTAPPRVPEKGVEKAEGIEHYAWNKRNPKEEAVSRDIEAEKIYQGKNLEEQLDE